MDNLMNIVPFDSFTIGKNIKKKVLIIGMNNLGFSIAKNLITSNILNITFRDKIVFSQEDINTTVTKNFININRAEGYKQIFESLHNNVNITILNDYILTEKEVKEYEIIIITEFCSNEAISLNKIARNNNIKFLLVETLGLYGYVFADYGDKYISENCNGLVEKSGKIIKITNTTVETEYSYNLKKFLE